jgi:outer membrane biosynthesis protein TonB
MTEPQHDFNSLDELFRKTFQNLPDAPAPNGWDTPSGKVWQHVQQNMPRPASRWTVKSIGLLSAFAVVLAVGLYMLSQPKPAAPVHVPQPTPTVVPPAANPEPATVAQPDIQPSAKPEPQKTSKPKAGKPQNPATDPVNSTQQATPPKPGSAKPLPGSNSDSHNSKEAEKNGNRN